MKIDLEKQWKIYLDNAQVKESQLIPIQRQEMKRAFFGGLGQALLVMRDEVGMIENEDEAVDCLQDMLNQVGQFWMAEQNKNN